jgi:hypothetical protein
MQVLMTAILADNPPLRLPLGRDALQRIERKLATLTADIGAWKALAEDTAFEEAGQEP